MNWSSSVIEEIEKEDKLHKSLADQGRTIHRISKPNVKRRWYATDHPPLSLPLESSSLLDPSRKSLADKKLFFSMKEATSLFHQASMTLEANSFL